jgi:hypothetical protein
MIGVFSAVNLDQGLERVLAVSLAGFANAPALCSGAHTLLYCPNTVHGRRGTGQVSTKLDMAIDRFIT